MRALITFAVAAIAAAAPARASFAPIDAVITVDAEQKVSADDPLYETGTDLLDEHEWRRAAQTFAEVERMHGPHADGALYWQAYAFDKLGMRGDALGKIVQLRKRYPKSRWIEDASALEVEIRHSLGETVRPDQVSDDDVKIIAVSGLMHREPERALPLLEGMLRADKPAKVKERALFVIAQCDAPEAQKILVHVAADNAHRDLQEHAIKYLGIFGGDANRKVLTQVYNSTPNVDVKRTILRTYTMVGDRARLVALARAEHNEELRGDAVLQLGMTGGTKELGDLYPAERALAVRKRILQAMVVGGNGDKLLDIARGESNIELKRLAIRDVGLLGGDRGGQRLIGLYDADGRREVRSEILNALWLQGNVTALRNIGQREKDAQLKRDIDGKLAMLSGKRTIEIHVDDDDE